MTVFKTYLKVLNKCKVPIIMYSVFLIIFGGLNIKNSDNSTSFVESKSDILIVNEDTNNKITNNLVNYITKNSNIIDIENSEEKRNDALFYRDVNYIIYIPSNYGKDFLNGKNPQIKIKSTKDYQASLANILLEKYIKVANIYYKEIKNEDLLIAKINETLDKKTYVEVTSKLDTTNLQKTTTYYNFLNYSMLAGLIYVICIILSIFKEEKVKKRITISSMDYKKHNRLLLLSNCLFAFVLWIIYILLSIILCGNIMFSISGLIYMLNSLIFTILTVVIAFLIGTIISNKDAINGIVNVIGLGTSFLCGAFVPMDFLPNTVLNIAHLLPSYYYIKTNEIIKTMDIFNFQTLKPIIINMIIMFIFIIAFIAIINIVSKKKRIID